MRGFALLGASSGSTSVTYGPNRPFLATTWWPVCGSVPSSTSAPAGLASSSRARSSGELVGGQVLGDVGPAAVGGLDVRPVASDPDDKPVAERERRQLARIDIAELADERLEPLVVAGAEVELGQLGGRVAPPGRDLVEHVLHARR